MLECNIKICLVVDLPSILWNHGVVLKVLAVADFQ